MEFRKVDGRLLCEMKSRDVALMEREYIRFRKKDGEIYKRNPYQLLLFSNFFNSYFQVEDGDTYFIPTVFRCSNYKIRDRLFDTLVKLEYLDEFDQTYCMVGKDGKTGIKIIYGDY